MVRGYPDWSPGAARNPEGYLLPTIAEAPTWFVDDFDNAICHWKWTNVEPTIITNDLIAGNYCWPYSGSGMMKISTPAGGVNEITRNIGQVFGTNNIGVSCKIKNL